MAAKLHWEDVQVGDEVPPFVRTDTGFDHWTRFGAANEELPPHHIDHDAGRARGLPGAIGMGNIRWAYLHLMLYDWIGDDGDIKEVSMEFRGLNLQHDTLTAWGKIVKKWQGGGENLVELQTGVRNQDGRETAPGSAVVGLPSRAK